MSDVLRCPECGREVPPDAPAGLCPECLLGRARASAGAPPTSVYAEGFVPPSPEQLAGRFPHLEVLEFIGKGGMGAVYKARQPRLDRLVALKILPAEAARDPAFKERFEREAQALAKLSHPNIVNVYDFGEADGLYYFLMEYVEGVTLRQLIVDGRLQPEQALAIIPQICEALQFAHETNIVHRDIKPENILLDTKGRVKIADFGLAKIVGKKAHAVSLTGTQQVMGTMHYMAPEQMKGTRSVDHRADIYSMGVVFYEMLTGELPIGKFEPPSRKVHVDVRLDEVVLRSLENEPERRYQQASEVKTDVEAIGGRTVAVQRAPSAERSGDAILRQVSGPATGLIATGVVNWIALPLGLAGVLFFRPDLAEQLPEAGLAGLAAAGMVLSGVMLLAGLKMKRLQAYPLTILGSVLALIVTPGNLIGFPIGVWALVTLSQRDVRQAFGRSGTLARIARLANLAKTVLMLLYIVALWTFFFLQGAGRAEEFRHTIGRPTPWFVVEKDPSGFRWHITLESWAWLVAIFAAGCYYAYYRIRRTEDAETSRFERPETQVICWGVLALGTIALSMTPLFFSAR